jgi:penicillin-binding protein 1C
MKRSTQASVTHRILIGILIVLILAFLGSLWVFIGMVLNLPDLDTLPAHLTPPSIRLTDRNGQLLYDILPQEGGRHANISLGQIPLQLQQATIATEDANFYTNPGVDWRGILRAIWINLQGGRTLSGGSTLTQQVARNLLLSQQERFQQTFIRKAREILLALQLSRHYSKAEILELYLNQTYYGGLSYGVEAAAQTYFGKSVSELDLAESALIAGLPQAPAIYNPFTDMKRAKARQEIVLGRMEEEGYITADQHRLAADEPLMLASTPYPMEAPHFSLMVRSQLDQLFTPQELSQYGSLTVRTSLNLDWQHLAEQAVRKQIEELKQTPDGLGHNLNSAALVALDPRSGEILALVGSPDYQDASIAGAINMVLSPRQPGSALKPLLYAAALDPSHPGPWTAATSILDVSTSFVTHDGDAYTPSNYDLKEHGPVLVREALASSLNIPAVKTLEHVGINQFLEFIKMLGISTLGNPDNYDLSLALGGGEVRLLDLTAAYAAFANGGYRLSPVSILDIQDSTGSLLYENRSTLKERVMDERLAWLITDILSDDNARVIGFGQNSILNLDRPAAVKTGTTSNFHDNWTVGYTPDLIVGVWAGNTNYEPMRDVSGVTGAAPIWHEVMRSFLSGQPAQPFSKPQGLVQVEVCALSGFLPTPACQYRHMEWFIEGTQPTRFDPFYKRVVIDPATGQLADETTPAERQSPLIVLDLPSEAYPWARSQGLHLLYDLHLTHSEIKNTLGTGSTASRLSLSSPLQIVSPASLSIFRLAADVPVESQQIHVEAIGESGLTNVVIFMDGQILGKFNSSPYETWWQLSPGTHQVWAEARSASGERTTSPVVTFQVKESK